MKGLPGGGSGKLGDYFEIHWLAISLAEILQKDKGSFQVDIFEKPEAVEGQEVGLRYEPPGIQGRGTEFQIIRDNGEQIFYQVKLNSKKNFWKINDLKKVLENFKEGIENTKGAYTFASQHDAPVLRTLCEHAKQAETFEEFENDFLKPSGKETKEGFENLKNIWGCGGKEAYELLKFIRVTSSDFENLRDSVSTKLQSLFSDDPITVLSVIEDFVLRKMHKKLTASEIWKYLVDERGLTPAEYWRNNSIKAAMERHNRCMLERQKNSLISSKEMVRSEAKIIFDKLTKNGENLILTAGTGMGKSNLLHQVAGILEGEDVPFIWLSMDNLATCPTLDDIGTKLGLNKAPTHILSSFAGKDKNAVLIVDQLDAISSISGKNAGSTLVLERIFKDSKDLGNVKILMACKTLDYENEEFLNKCEKEETIQRIRIEELTENQLIEALNSLGLDPNSFNPKERRLLRTPVYLKYLQGIVEKKPKGATYKFKSATDIIDEFWRVKNKSGFSKPLSKIFEVMIKGEVLSVAEERLDEFMSDINQMVSDGILVRENGQIRFFHESFFDYLFARSFLSEGKDLLNFLTQHPQFLSRRNQVRQIIQYSRSKKANHNEFTNYLSSLEKILNSSEVRAHIKEALLAWMRTIEDPTKEEWQILKNYLSRNELRYLVWGTIGGSVPWFKIIDQDEFPTNLLKSGSDNDVNLGLWLCSRVSGKMGERVAEILTPYVGVSKDWNIKLKNFLSGAEVSSKSLSDIMVALANLGVFDDDKDIWETVYSIYRKHPDWAGEIAATFLRRKIKLTYEEEFTPNTGISKFAYRVEGNSFSDEILNSIAGTDPNIFINSFFNIIIEAMEMFVFGKRKQVKTDNFWHPNAPPLYHDLRVAIFKGMIQAIRKIHPKQDILFKEMMYKLLNSKFDNAYYLAFKVCSAVECPKDLSESLVDVVSKKSTPLEIAYDSEVLPKLLKRITFKISKAIFVKLEKKILSEYLKAVKDKDTFIRDYCIVLLASIDPSKISSKVKKLLQENKDLKLEPKPFEVLGGEVKSPLPQAVTATFSDEEWIQAMQKYPDDEAKFTEKEVIGGSSHLAYEIQKQTQSRPERFANLLLKMPTNLNIDYFRGILRGLNGAVLDTKLAEKVIKHSHGIKGRPLGIEILNPLRHLSGVEPSGDTLDILKWYATDPSQEANKEHWREKDLKDPGLGREIHSDAINSVQGEALVVMAFILSKYPNTSKKLLPALNQKVEDKIIATRSSSALTLLALYNDKPQVAVDLFLKLAKTKDEAVLSSPYVERFLGHALLENFSRLSGLVTKMVSSSVPCVAQAGARRVALYLLSFPISEEAILLLEMAISGEKYSRFGLAEVFADNIDNSNVKDGKPLCIKMLTRLFEDDDDTVRKEAASCFFRINSKDLSPYLGIIRSFVDSKAFTDNCTSLIHLLEEATGIPYEDIFYVCEKFLEIAGKDAGDIRKHSAIDGGIVSKVITKIYTQNMDDERIREKSLDLIDKMVNLGVYGLDRELNKLDTE